MQTGESLKLGGKKTGRHPSISSPSIASRRSPRERVHEVSYLSFLTEYGRLRA